MPKKPTKQPIPEPKTPAVEDLSPDLQSIFSSVAERAVKDAYHAAWALLREEVVKALDRMFPDPEAARRRAVADEAMVVLMEDADRPGSRPPTTAAKRLASKAQAPAGPAPITSGTKACNVKGCSRPHRSMGYCGAHYQAARKYGWPNPCPLGFDAPAAKRGRAAKANPKNGAGTTERPAA